jgi:hypothetical protein
MALTDSLSVACKALGMAANIYFDKDRTKYNITGDIPDPDVPADDSSPDNIINPIKGLTAKQINRLHAIRKSVDMNEETLKRIIFKHFNKSSSEELTRPEYDFICTQLETMKNQQKNPA